VKCEILLISTLLACTVVSVSGVDTCEWTDYLGNPGRTAYSECQGPDTPEVLWEVNMPGVFDTAPFIINDKVLILWRESKYHTLEKKVLLLDVLTGEILQEFGQRRFLFSEIFPVDDKIVGVDGRRLYEIDLTSKEITLLTEIPERGFFASTKSHNTFPKYPVLRNEIGTVFIFNFNNYPVILKDRLIIPTIPTVCLSKSDFQVLWTLEGATSDPQVYADTLTGDETIVVFLANNDFLQLVAVDPSTGMVLWMSDPLGLVYWLALGKSDLYVGGKQLWAFDKNGSKHWEFFPDEKIVSNIVVADAVYAADAANNLYKIDFEGNLVWKTDYEGSPLFQVHLAGAGDILYCIGNLPDDVMEAAESYVSAYNMKDGSKLWNMHFADGNGITEAPALANSVLVMGTMGGQVITLTSDPDLYLKQGDAFLSEGLKDQAINSYKKAAQLFEKEGNLNKSQEIREKVYELENQQELTPEPSTPPESPPVTSNYSIVGIVILVAALFGIFVVHYFVKRKKF